MIRAFKFLFNSRIYAICFIIISSFITVLTSTLYYVADEKPRLPGCIGSYNFLENYYYNPIMINPLLCLVVSVIVFIAAISAQYFYGDYYIEE